ncbi:MAG: preprotein translocase subunit SecE [Planctomycetaceae bacterium]
MAGIQDNSARNGSLWGELFRASVYKPSQGRFARQVTFAAVAVAIGIGVWRSASLLPLVVPAGLGGDADYGVLRFLVPGLLLAAGAWFAFRLVNVPWFAEFLIAVEAEMAKVSWPSGDEVFRSSAVIIFLIFALAAILAGYDIFWKIVLRNIFRIG